MKKIILATALFATTAAATLANDRTHGAYVGLGLGPTIAHHKDGKLSDIFTGPLVTRNLNLTDTKIGFDLLVGYAFNLHSWHVGAELDYLFGNLNTNFKLDFADPATTNDSFAKVNSTGAFGAALRIGYHCDRLLAYIRLGTETRRFKISANSVGTIPTVIAANTINSTDRKTAFTPGIGFQFMMNKKVSTTLEYRYAIYGNIRKALDTVYKPTFTIKPRISTILISFRYHF